MENGGDSQENSTTPKAESDKKDEPNKKDDSTPVYSREVTLQAHFTFATPSMAPVQYAHVTPTATSSLGGRPLMASGAPAEHWRWTGDGPASGAQCSITCGREGLTMTYNAQPAGSIRSIPLVPCTICDSLVAAHPDHLTAVTTTTASTALPGTVVSLPITTCLSATPTSPTFTRSLMDLSKPQEQMATRSLTFSGSLDRATQRPVQQKPYGRRCKSTAHIVLQNNEMPGPRDTRPHEFHSTIREGATSQPPEEDRPASEPRGRARQRGGAESRFSGIGAFASSGWERLNTVTEEQEQSRRSTFEGGPPSIPTVPPLMPPCCPCHHCTALYSLMSSLAHERTCHACAHHHHHHHHHPPCSPSHPHTQGPPIHPYPHAEGTRVPPSKSPTTRTFNSHKCYEEEPGPSRRHDQRGAGASSVSSQRLAPPADIQQGKLPRTPSPGIRPRPPPLPESPESSPSPERPRRAPGVEQQQPQTTPHLPRRVPRMGAAAAAAAAATAAGPSGYSTVQGDGGPSLGTRERGTRAARPRPRPRTIHIDVYCSSSSEPESSPPSSPVSEDSLESSPRRPHAVVALGSKQRRKTEMNLGRSHYRPLEEKASSFVYSRGRSRRTHSGGRSAFITDDVLPLCASPPPQAASEGGVEEVQAPEPSTSAEAAHMSDTEPITMKSPIPMPAPVERPTTLRVPTSPLPHTSENSGVIPHSRHSSLSYLSSPLDVVDPWEGEPELPSSVLSWRGSEFETSTPRLTSEMDLPSPRPTSEMSLASLHEAFGERESEMPEVQSHLGMHDSPKQWRSPQLERQKYIQKGQEQRYREALRRRTQREIERSQTVTPTNVAELAKLPAFKDFSKEDLKVISKSLERRESLQSEERQSPFGIPEEFRPAERRESNRLLEWMQQYKAQERKESIKSLELKDSESLGYAESGKSLDRTDSFTSLESRESYGTVERKKPSSGTNGNLESERHKDKESPKSVELKELISLIERKESTRSLERRDSGLSAEMGFGSQAEHRGSAGMLERKDSFRTRDKREYYRTLERKDSGKTSKRDYMQSVERRDSGRSAERRSFELKEQSLFMERKDSRRHLERSVSDRRAEGRQAGHIDRSESCTSSDHRHQAVGSERSDSQRHLERRGSKASSQGSIDKKRSTSFLEELLDKEESSRSDSVEWQDVISTVRRRLSACTQKSPVRETVKSPEIDIPHPGQVSGRLSTPLFRPEATSPLPHQTSSRRGEDEDRELPTTTVGGRLINIGLFRHLPRFPFSQTVPVPASRLMEVRTAYRPEQRKFVRPQLFGEMTLSYPKRRGIHFGPPRNPQCSCENCCTWAELSSGTSSFGSHLRAWSMTDLGAEAREESMMVPQQPSSYPGTTLSRNNSNVSDSATLSHVGSAKAGRKQP